MKMAANLRILSIAYSAIVIISVPAAAQQVRPQVLFDFEGEFQLQAAQPKDATVNFGKGIAGRSLRIRTGTEEQWPGITLEAPQGKWDLSRFLYLGLDVKNCGTKTIIL